MDSNGSISINTAGRNMRRGISGSTLKLIAIFAMLIDHIGAAVLERMLAESGRLDQGAGSLKTVQTLLSENRILFTLYESFRLIGRIAFPVFCILLIEGFLHTRNKWKYASRLAVFAAVSEIPFDLAFYGRIYYTGHQNVFFTLLIGFFVMIGFSLVKDCLKDNKLIIILAVIGAILSGRIFYYIIQNYIRGFYDFGAGSPDRMKLSAMTAILSILALIMYTLMCKIISVQRASIIFTQLAVLSAGVYLAELLNTDYAGYGVLTIAVMYAMRGSRMKSMLYGCIILVIMSFSEYPAFINLAFISCYNGKRGLSLKYIFYWFYPVHLLALYYICYFMKLV